MITVTCDKCGNTISNGAYREITTNVVTPVLPESGCITVDSMYRVPGHHQLCAKCSREFDTYFDRCVSEFLGTF